MLEIKPILRSLMRSKAGAAMLIFQIIITTAIVSNAAFIINDRMNYLSQETGYPEDEIFSFSVMTVGEVDNLSTLLEGTEQLIRDIPGVINANLINNVPVSGGGSASGFGSQPASERGPDTRAAYFTADENIFETLGVTISEGRNFRSDEVIVGSTMNDVPQVVIVSKGFADTHFPEGNGLGQTIYFGNAPMQIIGIVDKMKGPWLKDSAVDSVVVMPNARASMRQKFIVRTEADQRDIIMRDIESVLLEESNKRVVTYMRSMDAAKANYNASDILMVRMMTVIICVIVLVTALGIFGMTVFNISKRTKQIGTRRALGARKSAILRYFLVENTIICIVSAAASYASSLFLGEYMMSEFSLPALDNSYIVVTIVCVFAISLLSVLFPALKAANIAPSIATRSI
ncbi:ABC transporter permease [Glaciecola sp. MH2013]|uniref:ABC transporter permease n=1 Tax=Glaciecola sp. MH2013 TaxID=2785524 RepID=UPI00189CBF1F|nr:FtsX-like permease family protein [Glaciecola sp. MH2013]MBF7074517.1 ABC transporter permease [Glaciecola sp. MH2013]